jgi:O-antigen/teichoic acid export membrane protein
MRPGRLSSESQGEARSERRIFAVLTQFAAMRLVLASAGLVRNKVVAFKLGPAAFGEITQIAAATAVASAIVCFGMGVSLSRNSARATSPGERQDLLANANGIVLCLAGAAVSVAVGLHLAGHLLPLIGIAQTPATVFAGIVFIAAIPVDALSGNYLALLQGILDVRALAIRRAAAVLLVTVVAVPVVWVFGFAGAAVQAFLLASAGAVLLGLRCRQIGYPPLRVRLDRDVIAHLASFGVVSLAAVFVQTLADTAVRTSLIESAGPAANGLLQAPYMLSATLKGVVLSGIGSVALASIASTRDRHEISAAVERLLNVVVPVGASALGLLGLLGGPVLQLLYSKAFAAGAAVFPYLLTADFLLVFVWVVGAPLLALGDRMLWLALDLLRAVVGWAVAVSLMAAMGATSVVIGYLAAVALHLVLTLAIYRVRYRLRLAPGQLYRLLAGIALVALLSIAGAHLHALPVLFGALAVWLAYTLYYARRSGVLASLRRQLGKG